MVLGIVQGLAGVEDLVVERGVAVGGCDGDGGVGEGGVEVGVVGLRWMNRFGRRSAGLREDGRIFSVAEELEESSAKLLAVEGVVLLQGCREPCRRGRTGVGGRQLTRSRSSSVAMRALMVCTLPRARLEDGGIGILLEREDEVEDSRRRALAGADQGPAVADEDRCARRG